nr:MAG TPA: major capsid protein [Caudoviricetes sp.]
MALSATQIFNIVNEVAQQAMGSSAIAVVDNAGLVALGNTVLGSDATKNNFINALTDRIGRTIVSFRAYNSHFPDFERDSIEWGNILQKLKIAMPDAEEDQSFNLVEGTSVDQYKINKAKVNQLLFTTESPWQTHITVHLDALEKAFVDSNAMGAFISGMFGEVQNRIELAMENLSIDCVNNYMAEVIKGKETSPTRVINLVTEYKDKTGVDHTKEPLNALNDEEFLKYVVRRINSLSTTMEYMTTGLFNTPQGDEGAYTRHTPKSEQRMLLFIDLVNSLKTNINSKAFNMEQVAIDIPFKTVPFWQSLQTPAGINIKPASGGTAIVQSEVMGILYDREAMGTFKKKYTSLTTPINAAGKYYNVFYHMITMYFNDLTENAVVFLLA